MADGPDPAQDQDFLNAPSDRQHAYLMSADHDYASAPPERQKAYLNHVASSYQPKPEASLVANRPAKPASVPSPMERSDSAFGRVGQGLGDEAAGNEQVGREYIEHGPKEFYRGAMEVAGRAPGQKESQIAHGFNRMVSGAGVTALPAVASALPIAAVEAPLATAASVGTGALAQTGTEEGLKAVGVNPETAKASGNAAGLFGAEFGPKALSAVRETVAPKVVSLARRAMALPLEGKVPEMTGTTPERIGELGKVQGTVADIHKNVLAAEKTARAAASEAYPEIKTKVEIPSKYEKGGWHDGHFVTQDELRPQKLDFKEAQQRFSQLGIDARAAHVARMRGQITGFDEAAILREKNELGEAMQEAARAAGKSDEFAAAQKQFREFMQDFHNKGSAIEPLLEMKPDETARIAKHFQNADKGSRAIEVLKKHGQDVAPIQKLLSRGTSPLKVDVNEAAKLRKLGTEGYKQARLQESLDQATTNRLPSGAEARLPAWAMRAKTNIPLLPEAVNPPIPTRFLTKQALKAAMESSRAGKTITLSKP